MANEEHLKKLREGWEAWEVWRAENPNVAPDLSDTAFADADFSFLNLNSTNFARTYFRSVTFSGTHLSHADLSHTTLQAVTFHRAILRQTTFTNSNFTNVVFTNVDLSRCRGLDTVRFWGNGSIGIDTFFHSGGLPESFLRGSGVPEEFITYATSLVGTPIEYYSCFISYSSRDEEFARRLYDGLQGKNIRTWFAPEDLKIGSRFRTEIDESIRLHDKLVLILSEHSIKSAWVRREVEAALEREDRDRTEVLFPIRVDDRIFESNEPWAAEIKRSRHIGDFRTWKSHDDYTKSFDRLVRDLKREGPILMKG